MVAPYTKQVQVPVCQFTFAPYSCLDLARVWQMHIEVYEVTNTRVPNIRARIPRQNNILANPHLPQTPHRTNTDPTLPPAILVKVLKGMVIRKAKHEAHPGTRGLLPSIFGTKPIRFDRCKWGRIQP